MNNINLLKFKDSNYENKINNTPIYYYCDDLGIKKIFPFLGYKKQIKKPIYIMPCDFKIICK